MHDHPHKLLTIAKREYLEGVRSPWFILATLFGPIVFGIILFIPALSAPSSNTDFTTALYNVRVLDATTTGLGERVAQILGGGKYANQPMPLVRVTPPAELAKAESLSMGEIIAKQASGYLVIDSQTVSTGAARYVGHGAHSALDTLHMRAAIREGLIGLRLEQLGFSPGKIDSVTVITPTLTTTSLNPLDFNANLTSRTALAFFLTMLLYICIVLYGQNMLSSVVEEKTTRVAEVVISSIRPTTLLSGKILGISAIGLTQQIVWILGAAALFALSRTILPVEATSQALTLQSSLPISVIVSYLSFFLLGFLFFGSLYAAAGATVSTESDARQAGQPIVLLLVTSILFLSPIVAAPDSTLARVLTILPITSPILMPLRMAITDVPTIEIAASFILLILTCLATIRLAARIYRVGLLMYGKRPSLGELKHWISQKE